jgi:hypothetical protein
VFRSVSLPKSGMCVWICVLGVVMTDTSRRQEERIVKTKQKQNNKIIWDRDILTDKNVFLYRKACVLVVCF